MRPNAKTQRSQAMPEFALVAPVLFLIIFGIFDFGRGIFAYAAIQTAANEAARVAIQGENSLGGTAPYQPPTSDMAAQAAIKNVAGITLTEAGSGQAPGGTCLNGPIVTSWAGFANVGVIYITDPETVPSPAGGPAGGYNGAGGDTGSTCSSWGDTPANGNVPLQATVVYHFQPITWRLLQIPQTITLTAWSVYVTEY
jgi:TadE-like protein